MVHTDQTIRRYISTFTTVNTPTSPSPTDDYDAVSFGTGVQTFQQNLMPPSTEEASATLKVKRYETTHRRIAATPTHSCHTRLKGFAFK